MKSKDLLAQLSRMQHSLHDFSFEELTSEEASLLKQSFEAFRVNLETKIFQPSTESDFSDGYSSDLEFCEQGSKNNTEDANRLIARVSHEIRTPLNGIIGFTDLLKDDEALNTSQLHRVDAIQKASYSLMEIISDLLEYSKLSAGMEKFESIDFDLRTVVGDISYLCKTLISKKKIALKTDIDPNIPQALIGDPSKLSQVLLNLLGNAIKFVEEGSIHLQIEQKTTEYDTVSLEFSVTDTGIGIADDHIEHIFDSFKQAETDTFTKYGGTGLGLHIVKQIVQNLGGEISVSSEPGVGTMFKFSIPYEVGNAENLKIKNSSQLSETQKTSAKNMVVLVFEDDLLNQKLIDEQLRSWGCKAYVTDNAEYGLHVLENLKIDVVLMDLKMPEMSGFEITRLIRSSENKHTERVPIIAFSADFSDKDKEQIDVCGINDFILKPYNTKELLSKLIANKKNRERTPLIESPSINHVAQDKTSDQLIDLSNIFKECMGQVKLLEELVTLYKQNALEFIGSASFHIKNNDFVQLKFAAHKVKSGLKMMRTDSLHSIILQIQNSCNGTMDKKHMEFLLNSFVAEYPKVEKAINAAMEKLKE